MQTTFFKRNSFDFVEFFLTKLFNNSCRISLNHLKPSQHIPIHWRFLNYTKCTIGHNMIWEISMWQTNQLPPLIDIQGWHASWAQVWTWYCNCFKCEQNFDDLLKYFILLIFQDACNLQNSLVFMGGRRFLVDASSDPHPLCIVRVLEVEGRS